MLNPLVLLVVLYPFPSTSKLFIYMYIIYYYIVGPTLFRGRLRAFGKCTKGVAFSKGRPNLASVHLTL